ncbi:MAG: hypothetical protein ACR2O4_03395 [Hyphomicrobiaceae bacterium]
MGMKLVEDDFGWLHAAVPHPRAPRNVQVMILKAEDGWWAYVDGDRIETTFDSAKKAARGAEMEIAQPGLGEHPVPSAPPVHAAKPRRGYATIAAVLVFVLAIGTTAFDAWTDRGDPNKPVTGETVVATASFQIKKEDYTEQQAISKATEDRVASLMDDPDAARFNDAIETSGLITQTSTSAPHAVERENFEAEAEYDRPIANRDRHPSSLVLIEPPSFRADYRVRRKYAPRKIGTYKKKKRSLGRQLAIRRARARKRRVRARRHAIRLYRRAYQRMD